MYIIHEFSLKILETSVNFIEYVEFEILRLFNSNYQC